MTAELVVVLAAITFAYFVKGVVGMGGPLLAIPVIASFTTVEHAVVVLTIANLLSNGWLLWEHRSGAAGLKKLMVPFLTVGTFATAFGTWLLTELEDRILSVVVAVVVVGYIARFLTDSDFGISRERAQRWSAPMGLVGGMLNGATGTGGPLIATYFHSIRMSRAAFVLVMSLTFQVFGIIQIGALVGLGAFTPDRTLQAVLAVIPVLAMTPLGIRLGRRVKQRAFELMVLGLLAFAAIRLLMSAL